MLGLIFEIIIIEIIETILDDMSVENFFKDLIYVFVQS